MRYQKAMASRVGEIRWPQTGSQAKTEDWAGARTLHPFEVFYQQEYPAVVALVYGLSGSRWTAEDLAQEAFERAHRDWAKVEAMTYPQGWVRRVAVNLAVSRLRRIRAEATALARLGPRQDWLAPPTHEFDSFWAEVRRLPRRQAQAIALRYVEDLPVKEIAHILGVAEGTAKALLHQGRERLVRQLSAKSLIDDEV